MARLESGTSLVLPDVLPSPKLRRDLEFGSPYRYYAGFSERFAIEILTRITKDGPGAARVLDPWNGSGTTTRAAARLGLGACGTDLNPAMTVIAKARMASVRDLSEVARSAALVYEETTQPEMVDDPLSAWFSHRSAVHIRQLARAIAATAGCEPEAFPAEATAASSLLMAGLFLAVRKLADPFQGTNPTWYRSARIEEERLAPSRPVIVGTFLRSAFALAADVLADPPRGRIEAITADSRSLPANATGATAILTSPPYCTRIDYAVATAPELATLGVGLEPQRALRRNLIGTTTVPRDRAEHESIPTAALDVLTAVERHRSKASDGYYAKWLGQYFVGMQQSLCELTAAAAESCVLAMVVQDSWYKDLKIPTPSILSEILGHMGWRLERSYPFASSNNRTSMNPKSRLYRKSSSAIEEVLIFTKVGQKK